MAIVEPPVPVLLLPFRGGEIVCCHLDGYRADREALLRRIGIVEAHLCGKPETARMRVWYNLDDTALDREVGMRILEGLRMAMPRIVRIAFVGIGWKRFAFERWMRDAFGGERGALVRAYIDDAEKAKAWLV